MTRYYKNMWSMYNNGEIVLEVGNQFFHNNTPYKILEVMEDDYVMAISTSFPTGGKKKISLATYREDYLCIMKNSLNSIAYKVSELLYDTSRRWATFGCSGSMEYLGCYITRKSLFQSGVIYDYIKSTEDYFFEEDSRYNTLSDNFERLMAYVGYQHFVLHDNGCCQYAKDKNRKCLSMDWCIDENTVYMPDGFIGMEQLRGDEWRNEWEVIKHNLLAQVKKSIHGIPDKKHEGDEPGCPSGDGEIEFKPLDEQPIIQSSIFKKCKVKYAKLFTQVKAGGNNG